MVAAMAEVLQSIVSIVYAGGDDASKRWRKIHSRPSFKEDRGKWFSHAKPVLVPGSATIN